MRDRQIIKLCPSLERLEEKQLLSAGGSANLHGIHRVGLPALAYPPGTLAAHGVLGRNQGALAQQQPRGSGLTLFRITNPSPQRLRLIPPFNQVLVQPHLPVAGDTYNVLSIAVRNGTARTFDASSGFSVRVTGQTQAVPVLTGTQQWKPGQVMVFYILTKQYYPMNPVVSGGFEFNLAGAPETAIPGPSGIFLRVKYNPATFPRVLDWIVAHGPGSKGHELGLPDTAVWQITSAKTNLIPL